MDANKLKVLQDIDYAIPETCERCVHADLPPGQDFGTCRRYNYTHAKHSGPARQLSIYRGGACPDFTLDPTKAPLGSWQQFLRRV